MAWSICCDKSWRLLRAKLRNTCVDKSGRLCLSNNMLAWPEHLHQKVTRTHKPENNAPPSTDILILRCVRAAGPPRVAPTIGGHLPGLPDVQGRINVNNMQHATGSPTNDSHMFFYQSCWWLQFQQCLYQPSWRRDELHVALSAPFHQAIVCPATFPGCDYKNLVCPRRKPNLQVTFRFCKISH